MELQAKIDAHNWFHSIDFGNGVVSKGLKTLDIIEAESGAFFDGLGLSGKSVLDIGAWNGAYSFEAKRRGARRVVAADKAMWENPHFKGRETFDLANTALGAGIEATVVDIPETTPSNLGTFDVVLFLGVFYHLFNAPELTRLVSGCSNDLLILETHQDALDSEKPSMVFYPGDSLNNDASNFWGPNPQCIYEILKECGFSSIFYQDSPAPHITNIHSPHFRQRGIFHAFRGQPWRLTEPKAWIDLQDAEARHTLFTPLRPTLAKMKQSSVGEQLKRWPVPATLS